MGNPREGVLWEKCKWLILRKIRSLELEFTWNGTQLSITTSQGVLPSV